MLNDHVFTIVEKPETSSQHGSTNSFSMHSLFGCDANGFPTILDSLLAFYSALPKRSQSNFEIFLNSILICIEIVNEKNGFTNLPTGKLQICTRAQCRDTFLKRCVFCIFTLWFTTI